MRATIRWSATLALAAMIGTAPALAQKIPSPAPADIRVVRGDNPVTGALNRQQAERAAVEDANNVQNAQTYQAQMQRHREEVARVEAARRAYEEQLAANNRARAAYDAAVARWRADVAACNAGNTARCGTAQPQQ